MTFEQLKQDVDIKFAIFSAKMAQYMTRTEEANVSIQNKIKEFADEVATVKNLIIYGDFAGEMKEIKSSNPVNYYPLGWGVVGAGTVGGIPSDPDNLAPTIRKISADLPKGMIAGLKITPKSNLQGVFQNVNLNLNEVHTFYVFARKVNASSTAQIRLKFGSTSITKDLTTKWLGYVLKFTPSTQSRVEVLFNKTGEWAANDEVQISKIQLAQTSEIVDYRPYSYVENAFKGSTMIDGGVVATNMVILNNEGGEIKSYVSGIDANPYAFAAGVTGFGTDLEERNIGIKHDGTLIAKNADIEGLIRTSSSGTRIILDPEKKALIMNTDDVEDIFKLSLEELSGGDYKPLISMSSRNGVFKSTLDPSKLRFQSNIYTGLHNLSEYADGFINVRTMPQGSYNPYTQFSVHVLTNRLLVRLLNLPKTPPVESGKTSYLYEENGFIKISK